MTGDVSISVRVNSRYVGIVDRFDVMVKFREGWESAQTWKTVFGLPYTTCAAGSNCTRTQTWGTFWIPKPQTVTIHGFAVNETEKVMANKLPAVTVTVQ